MDSLELLDCLVQLAWRVPLDLLGHLVLLVLLDSLGRLELKALKAHRGLQGPQGVQARRAQLDLVARREHQGQPDLKECRELRETLERQGGTGLLEAPELLGLLVLPELRVPVEILDLVELLEQVEQLVQREQVGLLEHLDWLAVLEPVEQLVNRDQWDQLGLKEPQVRPVQLDPLEAPVQSVQRDHLVQLEQVELWELKVPWVQVETLEAQDQLDQLVALVHPDPLALLEDLGL